jgi:DegV family protein with EDD domain
MSVKIVTDSTADLPQEVIDKYNIAVVPLTVHFGDTTYLDGVDIHATEFYSLLAGSARLPTTSQPSIGAMAELYSNLTENNSDIVSIHISGKLSGTLNSAMQAIKLPEVKTRIEIIDSYQTSMGLGLVVLAAARVASENATLAQVLRTTAEAISNTHTFVLVDTLEYLEKGGRIGKAQAYLGSLLKVKPILTMKDGEVHPLERARSRQNGMDRLYERIRSLGKVDDLGVIHSTTPDQAKAFAQQLSPLYTGEIVIGRFGPVIGTYLGPGALGVAVRTKESL